MSCTPLFQEGIPLGPQKAESGRVLYVYHKSRHLVCYVTIVSTPGIPILRWVRDVGSQVSEAPRPETPCQLCAPSCHARWPDRAEVRVVAHEGVWHAQRYATALPKTLAWQSNWSHHGDCHAISSGIGPVRRVRPLCQVRIQSLDPDLHHYLLYFRKSFTHGVCMKLRIVLEPSEEGGFTVFVPTLPACISEGESQEEALRNIREAIELYLESVEDDLALSPNAEQIELAV